MDHSHLMCISQRIGELPDEGCCLAVSGSSLPESFLQALPGDERGGNKILAGFPSYFKDWHDVRVAQLRRGLRLLQELVRVAGDCGVWPRDLQGNFSVQERIVRPKDATERAFADGAAHLEAPDTTGKLLAGKGRASDDAG
jgi:hypothetical protein